MSTQNSELFNQMDRCMNLFYEKFHLLSLSEQAAIADNLYNTAEHVREQYLEELFIQQENGAGRAGYSRYRNRSNGY